MNAVVIVAGGSGSRMKSAIPKQYMDMAGKPVIIHTIEKFLSFDPDIKIVLVMARGHRKFWDVISLSCDLEANITVALGGASRYESVKCGLEHINQTCIVGIHDAVRPFVSQEAIERCFESAKKFGSGIPVVNMDESVRLIMSAEESSHLDRTKIKRVQTPQVFQSNMIKKAYEQHFDPLFTDDASVFESLYKKVFLIEGNGENIKITTPVDLLLATILLRSSSQ